ncbi:hypothetical protein [Dyella sp.]|uniref:hypothetical protein n=1 Tax=Dyella sp. TaxID=1869338 RepID=UPI002D77BBDC|nr:hypothetical protein [Dyella sp.]HET7331421.1 hypothetical protein [Dyella sp.]
MHSTTSHPRHLLFLAVGAVALTCFGRPNVAHAGWIDLQLGSGTQCVSTGVNDNGVVVGYCTPIGITTPMTAWMVNKSFTPLARLAPGQSCSAEAVTNSGVILGSCLDDANRKVSVTWPVSGQQAVQALQSIDNRMPLSILTSYNQSGFVAGMNMNADESQIVPVIWPKTNGKPISISSTDLPKNCKVADINNSNINDVPSVALNCTNGGYIAKRGTSDFNATKLPSPYGTTCGVYAINDSVQATGSCYSRDGSATAAFWPNPTSAPTLLSGGGLPAGTRTKGTFLNNNGNVVVIYTDAAGKEQSAFWNTGAGLLYLISPVPGGTRTAVSGLANNDTVILNSEDRGQRVQAAKWTVATGTVPYGDVGGGLQSGVTTISPSGNYTAGGGEDSAGNEDALETSN